MLHIQEIKGNDYLMATVEKKGISTLQILSQALPKVIADLPFPKKMRWGSYRNQLCPSLAMDCGPLWNDSGSI